MRQVGTSTPHLAALAQRGVGAPMSTVLPAVTCSAQATMLTGEMPSQHGIVGNGWHFPDLGEPLFWRQSNSAIQAPKVYDLARQRESAFNCAKVFWWWNMGARVDWSITPRPFYPADGRKLLAVYGSPDEYSAGLEQALGPFPFFDFWGPKSGLPSSRWIADATLRTLEERRPTLTLCYLPHLDYDHQRFGPDDPRSRKALEEVDSIVGDLVAAADRLGTEVVVVSEYGIEAVDSVAHPNRALREAGLLKVRETPVGEVLDTYASRAFCVCDHQIAHVYTADESSTEEAARCLSALDGVERVLDAEGKREFQIDHERAGRLVVVARAGSWFAYPYWLDDSRAPDFARTVDIHRKPGYDPCELFVDPELRFPMLRVVRRLAQKKLGMRYLMDVIPLDASLIGGSHGRLPSDPNEGPVFLSSQPFGAAGPEPADGVVAMTSVQDRLLHLMDLG